MSRAKAEELGLEILAVLRGYQVAGVPPDIMGIGPVPSSRKAVERAGYKVGELARYEDPVALALMREVKDLLDPAGIMNPGKVLDRE